MMPDKVDRLLHRARQAIAERDWETAKKVYLMALGLRSDMPDVHYGLATVYFQLHELTSAAHHFREVSRLDPLRAGAFINLGAVLNLLHQYDDAIAALRRGIQLDSNRTEGYYNLGLVYKHKGQQDLAIQAYKEALRLNPRMPDAHLNLANLYLERDDPRHALIHYQQAAELRPGWQKAIEGAEHARLAAAGEPLPLQATGAAASAASPVRAAPPPGSDMDRNVDPVFHGVFLSNLHQASIVTEETTRVLQKISGDEVEPAIKELSAELLHSQGSRGQLDACLTRFEGALTRLRAAQQALKSAVDKLEEMGNHFPTH
ncbi:MAG: tetratricopeptide repeat protein [Gemmataceae bacterium]